MSSAASSSVRRMRRCSAIAGARSGEFRAISAHRRSAISHATSVSIGAMRPVLYNLTMINVSPNAASKINELLAEEQKQNSGLRVFVQGGGCSGFQYGLMIEETGG